MADPGYERHTQHNQHLSVGWPCGLLACPQTHRDAREHNELVSTALSAIPARGCELIAQSLGNCCIKKPQRILLASPGWPGDDTGVSSQSVWGIDTEGE